MAFIISRILLACFLGFSACQAGDLGLDLETHAITENYIQILKKTSQFAPIRETIHRKSWKQTLKLSSSLSLPLQALPTGFQSIDPPSFPLFCLRFLMSELEHYQQEQEGSRFHFRGGPNARFERAYLDEASQAAVYKLADGTSIRETYFKDSKGRFRVRSEIIRFPFHKNHRPHTLQWKIEFLKFGYFPPGFETVKKLLPKRTP